jgi:hypothetical protein
VGIKELNAKHPNVIFRQLKLFDQNMNASAKEYANRPE